jgi:hypothetical protein
MLIQPIQIDLNDPLTNINFIRDSVSVINSILASFNNTEDEKYDLNRNIDYIEHVFKKSLNESDLSEEELASIKKTIDEAKKLL